MNKGSLVLVDFSSRVKDTGEVIETTLKEDAKKFGVFDESKKYEPKLVAIGEGWVLKGLDEALISAKLDTNVVIDIPPEKAFGIRDPEKVRRIPLRKLGEKAGEIRVGDEIEIDHRIGLVRFIGSGRTQIDFNQKYAGKVITYEFKVLKEIKLSIERAMALLRRRLSIEEDKISMNIKDEEITIALPQEAYMIDGLQIIKKAVSMDIFKYVSVVTKVTYIETYGSSKPKTEVKTKKMKPTQVQPQPKLVKRKKGSDNSS